MTKFLLKIFVKNYKSTTDNQVRQGYGVLSSVVCIVCNVLLSAGKIIIGMIMGLISVTADGLNNLSDCGSNIVATISFKMSNKPADKEHPYGHQRIEYISSMIVAFLILTVSFQLVIESINKIINPTPPEFGWASIIILIAGILVKLWMFVFNRRLGKAIDSSLLLATATDSISDVFATVGVLVAVVVSTVFGINIDGYMSAIVAIVIAVAGIKILRDTMNELLGKAPSKEIVDSIKTRINSFGDVMGIHDLDIHRYGHNRIYASVHIEVDANQPMMASHDLADRIEKDFATNTGIVLVVHIDPIVIDDPRVNRYRQLVTEIVAGIDGNYCMHDFRMVEGVTHSNLIFDVAVPFECTLTNQQIIGLIEDRLALVEPNLYVVANIEKQNIQLD